MKIEYFGDGVPDLALIGTVHGDEPCGGDALSELRFLDDELDGCVITIRANEKAAAQGERYIDVDLNRSYHNDKRSLYSKHYEERLAAIIHHLTEDIPVYDLHSTSIPTPSGGPFAIFAETTGEVLERVRQTGVNRALYFDLDDGSGLKKLESVEIEHTPKGSEKALRQARSTVKQILSVHGLIDNGVTRRDPEVYRVTGEIGKGDWDIVADNWTKVEEGETIAMAGTKPIPASEEFVPVLFSEDYDDKLGYKAKAPQKLSEFEQET